VTHVYTCSQCGYRWNRLPGGGQAAARAGSGSGAIAQAARRLEAAERRRWRDSAAWGDFYPREGDR
jgi:hypothetical protein